jgi:hypothetical protein
MARLRTETAPEITVNDESVVFKAATGATAPLVEFKNSSGTVVGNIAANGVMNVTSVVASNAGTGSTALATRAYVDSLFAGVNWHDPVALATTAALPTCNYDNGTDGVGATLTATANGALTVDSGTVSVGYSILVKNQADAKQNGVYSVTATGSAGAVWVLTRRDDSDNNPSGEVQKGDAIFVIGGSTNVNCGFILSGTPTGANDTIVFGTDSLVYSQFTGTGAFTAGNGLLVTNNTVDVVTASVNRIVVNADSIDLATVTQSNSNASATTNFVTGLTVDSYGRITGTAKADVSFTGYATLAGPTFTGVPLAPTAAVDTNNTQIATTAFVVAQITDDAIVKTVANAKGDIFTATANDTPAILSVGTDGQRLAANSSATSGLSWAAHDLDSLTDVVISTPANNQFLKYNGSAWVNAVSTEIQNITDLADVTITSASNNQFIRYNGSAWVNSSVAEIVNINDLLDVTISSAAVNQVLLYNGSAWVNTSNPTIAGNLVVSGNLTVSGTTVTVNTSTLSVADNIITLNSDVTSGSPSENAGIEVSRGSSATVSLRWNETTDRWEFTTDGTYYQTIYTDTVTNAQTAAYTLALADNGKMVEMNVASGNALTVPSNANVAFPVGTTLTILQTGAGQTTLTPQSGVTINATPGLKLRTQWASATLIKRATDTWVALGDLAA